MSIIHHIKHQTFKYKIKIAFKSKHSISTVILNNKENNNKFNNLGVCNVIFPDYNVVYIGRSGNFQTTYKEHHRSFKIEKTDSTFTNYWMEKNHKLPHVNYIQMLHNTKRIKNYNSRNLRKSTNLKWDKCSVSMIKSISSARFSSVDVFNAIVACFTNSKCSYRLFILKLIQFPVHSVRK